jgi:type II secretory pathway component PulF
MSNFISYRLLINHIILKIPVFGAMSRDYNLATIARTLSLLLKSDVRIVQSLEISGNTLKNEAYKRALRHVEEGVLHGQLLSAQLSKEGALFPSLFVQMVAVGEATGNLSESLMYLSDMYESEINDTTKNLSTILEPILMLVMGMIVGFIAISIITPIYGITQNLHR